MDEVWYDFEGDTSGCDDECKGWDGTSRRCDCGNRRVDWDCIHDDCIKETEKFENCKNCKEAYAKAF